MQTYKTIQMLERERKTLETQLEAIDRAIEALTRYKSLNGSTPVQDAQIKGKKSIGRKRKLQCPDCDFKAVNGTGLSVHGRTRHDWSKGYTPWTEEAEVSV